MAFTPLRVAGYPVVGDEPWQSRTQFQHASNETLSVDLTSDASMAGAART